MIEDDDDDDEWVKLGRSIALNHGGNDRERSRFARLLSLLPFRYGDSRWVLLMPPFVVLKVPRPKNWSEGIASNLQEREWSTRGFEELCPVVCSSRRGWLVVMRWARPLSDAEWERHEPRCLKFCLRRHPAIPVEAGRRSSYGIFQGRVVAVDYGTPS
jgi:hypothetical protein